MAGEIASAFVRIRPNTAGFQTEAETGLRGAFTGLAKAAAGVFAATEGIKFGKEIIGHAADVQKQIEVVRNEFGKAAEAVLHFNENGAAALGISAHLADTTSARFGILFKNLGIGQEQAAKMTVGFEQLAGSLSAIRGVDPALVLKNIPLAVAGNLRSLKQLGIATDQTQLKIAAFKLGLTNSVKQGLTPAIRAQAIFAIATAHLGDFMDQAKAHAGDLRNRTLQLRAEWDNAKDALGNGLLPVMASLATFFAKILPSAVKITQRIFADFRDTVKGVVSFLAPAFQPIIVEFHKVQAAFQVGGIHAAIQQIIDDFQKLSPVAKVAVAAVAGIALAFAATTVASSPILAITALVVGLREAYTHSARFRDIVKQVSDFLGTRFVPAVSQLLDRLNPTFRAVGQVGARAFTALASGIRASLPTLLSVAETVKNFLPTIEAAAVAVAHFATQVGEVVADGFRRALPAIREFGTTAKAIFSDLIAIAKPIATALAAVFVVTIRVATALWHQFGGTIKAVVSNTFGGAVTEIRDALRIIRGIFDVFTGIFTGDWRKAWGGLKEIVSGALDGVKTSVQTFANNLEAIFSGMWQAIEKLFLTGVEKIVGLLAKIPSVSAHIPHVGNVGFTNPFKGFDESLKATIGGIGKSGKDRAREATDAVTGALTDANSIFSTFMAGLSASTGKTVKDAADVIGQGADSAAAAAQSQKAAAAIRKNAQTVADGLAVAVKTQDAAVKKAKGDLAQLSANLKNAITQEAQDMTDAVGQAKQNLLTIGSSLSDAVGQILDKPLQELQAKLSSRQNKLNLSNLSKSILLPGGAQLSADPKKALAELEAVAKRASVQTRASIQDFIIQYQQASLAVRQDQVDKTKEMTSRRIADLTDSFNRGKITAEQLKKGILGTLKADHVSYKIAGQLLGSAFANGFRDAIKGLLAQAKAIAETPAKFRGNASGAEPQIVHPLQVLQKDQREIGKIQHQIGNKQIALQQRIAKATETAAKEMAALKTVKLGPTSAIVKNPGKQGHDSAALNGTTG